MLCNAPLADIEREEADDWCDFSSSQVLSTPAVDADAISRTTASSSIDALSSESFRLSAESLEDLVASFDKVVAKCLRTSISLDGIVPAPRIRHLDDLVEEECGNSYFSAFLTPNYLERLANVKWSECRTRALFADSMQRLSSKEFSPSVSVNDNLDTSKRRHKHNSHKRSDSNLSDNRCSSTEGTVSDSSESSAPSRSRTEGDLHALMVSSVAEADFNETQPVISADDVINEIEAMMREQEEADAENGFNCETFFSNSNDIAMIDDAAATVDSGYDVSMTSSALSVLPTEDMAGGRGQNSCTAKLKPLPVSFSGNQSFTAATSTGKFVAQSPQHSEDVVQLFLAETLSEMTLQELENHAERLEVAIRKYSDVLVQELAMRDEQVDLKETRDHFVGLVMSVQRRVREISSTTVVKAPSTVPSAVSVPGNDIKKRNSPFVTTVIPYNPDSGPLPLDELRVLTKILQAMLDDSPAVPALLTEYILTVLCAKENPRI